MATPEWPENRSTQAADESSKNPRICRATAPFRSRRFVSAPFQSRRLVSAPFWRTELLLALLTAGFVLSALNLTGTGRTSAGCQVFWLAWLSCSQLMHKFRPTRRRTCLGVAFPMPRALSILRMLVWTGCSSSFTIVCPFWSAREPLEWDNEFSEFANQYAQNDNCLGFGDERGLSLETPFGSDTAHPTQHGSETSSMSVERLSRCLATSGTNCGLISNDKVCQCPLGGLRLPGAQWVKPQLVARVRHLAAARQLRHGTIRKFTPT